MPVVIVFQFATLWWQSSIEFCHHTMTVCYFFIGWRFFSNLNHVQAYYWIPAAPEDVPKTAITTPFGCLSPTVWRPQRPSPLWMAAKFTKRNVQRTIGCLWTLEVLSCQGNKIGLPKSRCPTSTRCQCVKDSDRRRPQPRRSWPLSTILFFPQYPCNFQSSVAAPLDLEPKCSRTMLLTLYKELK